MVTIHEDRVARLLAEAHLRSGQGKGANGTIDVCIMQAVDWIAGGNGKSDAPVCVDRVIRNFCIRLNDAERFAQWRDELKSFAARMAGTNAGDVASITRGFICADHTIRVVAPLAFEFWAAVVPAKADVALEWAKKLRDVPPIVDKASAIVGRDVAREARKVAADAASAADAAYAASAASAAYAAYAASAASAAYAASAADAASAASAASAADAADVRAKAEALTRRIWDESLVLLERMIAVTEVPVTA